MSSWNVVMSSWNVVMSKWNCHISDSIIIWGLLYGVAQPLPQNDFLSITPESSASGYRKWGCFSPNVSNVACLVDNSEKEMGICLQRVMQMHASWNIWNIHPLGLKWSSVNDYQRFTVTIPIETCWVIITNLHRIFNRTIFLDIHKWTTKQKLCQCLVAR